MSYFRGFTHPVPLAIALTSVALSIVVDLAAPWSDRGLLLLLWGFVGYVVAVALVRTRVPPARSRTVSRPAGATEEDLSDLVEEALRHLNNPAQLINSRLIVLLSMSVANNRHGGTRPGDETPLEQAQCLRDLLVAGIDRMRLSATNAELGALHYFILHEEYVLGQPNVQVMTRHNIAESTFHRYRRQGIRVLAEELARQEQRLHVPGPQI